MSEAAPVKSEPVIRIRGLVNAFGDSVIHDHLDLDVYRGEVLGVVGGSGAGKSVLLRSIIGFSGSVQITQILPDFSSRFEAFRRREFFV